MEQLSKEKPAGTSRTEVFQWRKTVFLLLMVRVCEVRGHVNLSISHEAPRINRILSKLENRHPPHVLVAEKLSRVYWGMSGASNLLDRLEPGFQVELGVAEVDGG